MTSLELANLQDAFVIVHSFSIELALGLLLMVALVVAILWILSVRVGNGQSQ